VHRERCQITIRSREESAAKGPEWLQKKSDHIIIGEFEFFGVLIESDGILCGF
jgi:hypothetical protein